MFLGLRYHMEHRVALGTDGQSEGGILDVTASEDISAVSQDRCADAEVAVGAVGMFANFFGPRSQIPDSHFGDVRHILFLIGCWWEVSPAPSCSAQQKQL